jgi:UDP-glucose 4-epimerase
MNWLITGGCGFIGTCLVRHLLQDGDDHRILVLDNLSVGTRADLAEVADFVEVTAADLLAGTAADGRVRLVAGDILDESVTRAAAAGCDAIVHLAANTGVGPSVENPRADCMANVVGTFNMLEAARAAGVRRFVFASSGAPMGNAAPPFHEEMAPHPVSPYGASKAAGEAYCSAYAGSFGIQAVGLRFGNVYGPRSTHKGSVVAKFIREALAGETLEIYGDGAQTRDFIFVDDLLDAIVRAARTQGIGGEVFQIATNSETTVDTVAGLIAAALQRRGIATPQVRHGEPRVGDVLRNYSIVAKARERLGWAPQTPLPEGVERTVDWFLERMGQPLSAGIPSA